MKRIIFVIAALAAGIAVSAQEKGEMLIGGSISLSTSSTTRIIENGGTTVTGNGNTITDGHRVRVPGSTTFGIEPEFGIFVADNWLLGVGAGYEVSASPMGDGHSFAHDFLLTPYVSYYVKLADKLFWTPTVSFGAGFLLHNMDDGTVRHSENRYLVNIGVCPLALEYKFAEHFALEAKLASMNLGFSGNSSVNVTSFSLGAASTVAKVGIVYIF